VKTIAVLFTVCCWNKLDVFGWTRPLWIINRTSNPKVQRSCKPLPRSWSSLVLGEGRRAKQDRMLPGRMSADAISISTYLGTSKGSSQPRNQTWLGNHWKSPIKMEMLMGNHLRMGGLHVDWPHVGQKFPMACVPEVLVVRQTYQLATKLQSFGKETRANCWPVRSRIYPTIWAMVNTHG
jgi:hypothetical protein